MINNESMLIGLVIILIILWFFGYIRIDGLNLPDLTLFSINNQVISLWDFLILMVVSWAISILPSPIREIAGVLLILWILSVLGILAITGLALSNILVVAIIVGLIISIFSSRE